MSEGEGNLPNSPRLYYKNGFLSIFNFKKGEFDVVDIIFDILYIILSLFTIVVVLKMWRGKK